MIVCDRCKAKSAEPYRIGLFARPANLRERMDGPEALVDRSIDLCPACLERVKVGLNDRALTALVGLCSPDVVDLFKR